MANPNATRAWIGIDEAGYGPNLGPLTMSAVMAETSEDRDPDVWADLPNTIDRAGGSDRKLWIDDSKKVYAGRRGRDRLEAGVFAALDACGRSPTLDPTGFFNQLQSGDGEKIELTRWLDPQHPPAQRHPETNPRWSAFIRRPPFAEAPWKIANVQTVVYGPERFQTLLDRHGSKATVHFHAFTELLRNAWASTTAKITRVRCDKHGGRNYYAERLRDAFPEIDFVEEIIESADQSTYVLHKGHRKLELSLEPKADSGDGLVALASMVSKTAREFWMDIFNQFWTSKIPNLKPTAGYPVDALRFRKQIQPEADRLQLPDRLWWRQK